jgi:nucleoside-diphosphate-sugar epimerase
MRFLLTGATGFLGSRVLRRLLDLGEEVAVILRSRSNPWRIRDSLGQVRTVIVDPVRPAVWPSVLDEVRPEVVIHLAWHGVAAAQRNDPTQIDLNLIPTLELGRATGAAGCRAFIGIGSQAEYGPRQEIAREDDPTLPSTLYGATKLAAGILLRQTFAGTDTRFAWVRVFSTYGPGDASEWFIPQLIRAMLGHQAFEMTLGEQLWDYLFVDDAAAALIALAQSRTAQGVFNLGSGKVVRIREVAEKVRTLAQSRGELKLGAVPYRPDQVMHLQADVSRLKSLTGWSPKVPLDLGLKLTVEGYRSHA